MIDKTRQDKHVLCAVAGASPPLSFSGLFPVPVQVHSDGQMELALGVYLDLGSK